MKKSLTNILLILCMWTITTSCIRPLLSKIRGSKQEQTEKYQNTTKVDTATPSKDNNENTPDKQALPVTSGGVWQPLQSGEIVYEYTSNGEFAREQWIYDHDGKVYYVDVSGCRMINNYTKDGYATDAKGAWDQTKPRRTKSMSILSDVIYKDESETTWTFTPIRKDNKIVGGSAIKTYSFGSTESFDFIPSGPATYTLLLKIDPSQKYHLAVLSNGQKIRVSCAGSTEEYETE